MKHSSLKTRSILNVLLVLAVLAAMLIPVMPAAAGSGYSPITVWLGANSITIDQTTWDNLKTQYSQTVTGIYGSSNYSYTGVPVYRILEQISGVSALSGYSALIEDNSSPTYKVLVGPHACDNITVKGNDTLIIADNGTINGSFDITRLPRLVCSSFTGGGKYYNQSISKITLVNTVSVTASVNGTISPDGYSWSTASTNPWTNSSPPALGVDYNSSQSFNLTPSSGYQVASITTDAGPQTVGSGYTFDNVTTSHTLTATFTPIVVPTYTISTSTDGNGAAVADPASVSEGGSSAITITPNSGYSIAAVTDNGTDVTSLVVDGVYTLTNITANHTINVTFTLNTTWTLQIINAGVTYNMSKSEFESLPSVTINVTDMHGTHDWTGVPIWKLAAKNDGDGDPNAFNEVLAASNYNIKASSTGSDPYIRCVGPTSSNNAIAHNDNLIVANLMDGSPLPEDAAPLKVVGTDLISSRFVSQLASLELVYTITKGTTTNGSITPVGNTADRDGIVGVSIGDNQTFTIAPDTGYHIDNLTVDNVSIAPLVSTYTFDNVTANHTIAATFAVGIQNWPFQLIGASTHNITKTEFESLAAAHPSSEYTDSSGNTWKGVALYRLIGMVDDADSASFNSALANYYSLKLTAADGFNKTVAPSDYAANFTFVDNESVIVANKVMLNGTASWVDLPLSNPTKSSSLWYPLIDTGSGIAIKNLRVAALVKIELLNLPAAYTISTSSNGNGTVVAEPGTVISGGSSTVTITPASGYSITGVTDNGTDVTSLVVDGVYTLTNITANHTIAATFTLVSAVEISVVTPPGAVAAESSFEVALHIDTNTAVRGWQTNVSFDQTKLTAGLITEGPFLSDWASDNGDTTVKPVNPTINNTTGQITGIAYAIVGTADLGGPTGSGTLCTITFTAKEGATGLASITPANVIVSDVEGLTLSNVEVSGAQVTIAPPGPPTLTVNLAAGWNTFSTPISLNPQLNTLGQIFSGAEVSVALGYDAENQEWFTLENSTVLKPCEAIFVYMDEETSLTLPVNQALTAPPSSQLYAGWNLVSLANLEAMDVDTALISVKNIRGGLTGYVQVVSPEVGNQIGWVYVTGQTAGNKTMKPFEGYWVYMLNDGMLAGFTTTPLN